MEINPEDKKVIDLLSKLKNSSGAYPSDILASRRQNYLKQVANVGLGIGVGTGLKNAAKSGNGAGAVATVTSKILETALIAAIAIEAGTVAYLYREKIADAVRTYTGSSNVQEIASPANDASAPDSELVEATEFPVVIVTTPSGTVTAPSVTISGSALPDPAGDANNNNGTNVTVNATPDPGGNNGNQYGLTPKPVRTIDNTDNGGGGNGDGNSGDNGGGNDGGNGGGNGNNNRP